MANGDKNFDWRAVGAFVALVIGLFTVTNFLTNDKIDSKIQQHSISTEAIHQQGITKIKEDIAGLKKGQDVLEKQNERIIEKLDELQRTQR